MEFKDRLKELRKSNGYTQNDMATLLEVTTSTVAMWESGKRHPTIETLKSLARLFNVSMDYLTGNNDMKNIDDYIIAIGINHPAFKKFLELDDYGKKNISSSIDNEFKRCKEQGTLMSSITKK